MTQLPLKIFNLVGNEIRIETLGMDNIYPHAVTRINPERKKQKTGLAGDLAIVAQMAQRAGHDFAIVTCGIGNPAKESCEQRRFIVPADEAKGLVSQTTQRVRAMNGAKFSRVLGK